MAAIAVLAGGLVGFFSAMFSLIALNVSWVAALGLWACIGTVGAAAVLAVALMPRSRPALPRASAKVAQDHA